MAESAVGFLLENVKELALYYKDLLNKEKAKDDQEELELKLRLLKSILKDASDKPKKSEPFKQMERRIREVVYQVEDIIDSCYCYAIEHKAKGKLKRKFTTNRIDLAEQVKLAKVKVNSTLDLARSELAQMPSADPIQIAHTQNLKSAPLLRHENVVVLEDQEAKVYDFLEDTKNDKLDVYSIVGMPGLGKSTLAWNIFRSERVRVKFPIHLWVYVSPEFNCRNVLLKILKGIDPANSYDSLVSDEELKMEVRKHLKDCTFLLVLDDVWTPAHWTEIENALPKNNSKGKVLITTRHNETGNAACVHSQRSFHELRFLKDPESWKLLQYEVFGKLDAYPNLLKEVGYKIAVECEGLPLAVVVTGGILKQHYSPQHIPQTIAEWKDVSANVSKHLRADKAKHLVGVSYSTLSDELKHCLVYLGVFPKGLEIPVSTLTRLWIAEGFVQQKEEQSPEKIAQDNLNDLISRNLVMAEARNLFGEVKRCRVHDVIREFCTSEADIDEQNLFREIKMLDGKFSPSVDEIHKHRRLCIHSHLQEFLSKKPSGTSVARSFLCFSKESIILDNKYNASIAKNFKLLRVLDSVCFKFAVFPLSVKELNHLRYLTLSCDIDELPEEISSKLWNLRTLILHTSKRQLKLKANIWKMERLRHLKTKAAIVLPVEHRGVAGENLHTLTRLSTENCKQDVFDKARYLKRLGIRGPIASLLNVQFSAGTLSHLENLKLHNDLINAVAAENPLPAFPKFLPATLKRLTLSKTYLQWMHMPALAKIQTLEVLKLKDYAFDGDSWKLDGYGFPSLQLLLIDHNNLRYWQASTEQFPRLWRLTLKKCKNLLEIPMCLATSTLQNLDLEHVHSSAVECAKKIKEQKSQPEGANWGRFELSITVAPGQD